MSLLKRRTTQLNILNFLCCNIISTGLSWLVFGLMLGLPSQAQSILSDTSGLTTVRSLDGQNFTITNGQTESGNLFHSFANFSIPDGGSATFDNALNIVNIISRVTGDRASNIQGTLSAQGAANVFLLNPKGIVLGENAELNIGGSFIGSTADSILFPNDVEFSATDTQPNPLLSVSAPVGLQMGSEAGEIRVEDAGYQRFPVAVPFTVSSDDGLQVNSTGSLVLVGNGISFEGGKAIAPGGLIALGSVENGQVDLTENSWLPSYEKVTSFSDIKLNERSLLNASNGLADTMGQPSVVAPHGGNIHVQARQLSLDNSSIALIQNFGNQASGDIFINASERVSLLATDNTTGFAASNFVPTDVPPIGTGFITANFAQNLGGSVHLSSPVLELIDEGVISVETFGPAPSGNINLNSSSIRMADTRPGNLRITSGIQTVSYSPFASGVAGDITLFADDVTFFGDGLSSQSLGVADSGTVTITSDAITLLNGSTIASVALGQGNGGELIVNANDIFVRGLNPMILLPSGILATSVAAGNAGNVTINTQRLLVEDGGRIGASATATGDAGQVTINATESIMVSGTVPGSVNPSLIISAANVLDPLLRGFLAGRGVLNLPAIPTGDAGDVTLNTPFLSVSDGAQVTVRNDGPGNAGELTVNAQSIFVRDRAGITASTTAGGGGNLFLNADDVLLLRGEARLSAEARGIGDGGNITLNTTNLVAVENSDIIANAEAGQGGNIQITAKDILGTQFREALTAESDITASSEFGTSGIVEINNLAVDVGAGLVQLPDNVEDSSDQIVAGCADTLGGQFIATGRGGLAINPSQALHSFNTWSDVRSHSAGMSGAGMSGAGMSILEVPLVASPQVTPMRQANARASVSDLAAGVSDMSATSAITIREASGWRHSEQGDIVLHAPDLALHAQRHNQLTPNCLATAAPTGSLPATTTQ